MSFQRTRMSADRTLMSVMRTSLSLISFGFTIYQVFQKLHASNAIGSDASARHFGMALVLLGVLMLVIGIIYHLRFMIELRAERASMAGDGLIHAESRFPASMTLITAVTLLGIGIAAAVSMGFNLTLF
jgi:putative membrane protein